MARQFRKTQEPGAQPVPSPPPASRDPRDAIVQFDGHVYVRMEGSGMDGMTRVPKGALLIDPPTRVLFTGAHVFLTAAGYAQALKDCAAVQPQTRVHYGPVGRLGLLGVTERKP